MLGSAKKRVIVEKHGKEDIGLVYTNSGTTEGVSLVL
jgi:hypothetical protein